MFGHALTVYRQQALNLGPGVADIQVVHYHTFGCNAMLYPCYKDTSILQVAYKLELQNQEYKYTQRQ